MKPEKEEAKMCPEIAGNVAPYFFTVTCRYHVPSPHFRRSGGILAWSTTKRPRSPIFGTRVVLDRPGEPLGEACQNVVYFYVLSLSVRTNQQDFKNVVYGGKIDFELKN